MLEKEGFIIPVSLYFGNLYEDREDFCLSTIFLKLV